MYEAKNIELSTSDEPKKEHVIENIYKGIIEPIIEK